MSNYVRVDDYFLNMHLLHIRERKWDGRKVDGRKRRQWVGLLTLETKMVFEKRENIKEKKDNF